MMKARITRPLIAIHGDYAPTGTTWTRAGYFEVIQAVGGLPLLLPASVGEAEIQACLEKVQGVILDGGPDVEHRQSHATPGLLIRHVRERQVPLLAFGQGMQQLNAAAGGTLYPPMVANQPYALAHSKPRHTVLLEAGTRVEEIYGTDAICVNNEHRQTVRRIGAGLRVGGLAVDGVIEAIEAAEPGWFCVGIQWQPETDAPAAPDLRLFEHFLGACMRPSRPVAVAA
jgi:putative glutamine amidotransferase